MTFHYPYKECPNGHPLEKPEDFIHDRNHVQRCRRCVRETANTKRRTTNRHRMID